MLEYPGKYTIFFTGSFSQFWHGLFKIGLENIFLKPPFFPPLHIIKGFINMLYNDKLIDYLISCQ